MRRGNCEIRRWLGSLKALPGGVLLAVMLCTAIPAVPASDASREYRVKAAFLYNFAKFVVWPDTSYPDTDQVHLCVLGDDPFDAALSAMAGKKVRGRKVAVGRFGQLEETAGCQIVFVAASERERLEEIFDYSTRHHLLTVSDIEDFTTQGGIIGLITVNNKVRFEINLKAARKAGLSISSNLLKLATTVRGRA